MNISTTITDQSGMAGNRRVGLTRTTPYRSLHGHKLKSQSSETQSSAPQAPPPAPSSDDYNAPPKSSSSSASSAGEDETPQWSWLSARNTGRPLFTQSSKANGTKRLRDEDGSNGVSPGAPGWVSGSQGQNRAKARKKYGASKHLSFLSNKDGSSGVPKPAAKQPQSKHVAVRPAVDLGLRLPSDLPGHSDLPKDLSISNGRDRFQRVGFSDSDDDDDFLSPAQLFQKPLSSAKKSASKEATNTRKRKLNGRSSDASPVSVQSSGTQSVMNGLDHILLDSTPLTVPSSQEAGALRCPLCDKQMPEGFKFSRAPPKGRDFTLKSRFCKDHDREIALAEWAAKGLSTPEIDWKKLPKRIEEHFSEMEEIIYDQAKSHFKDKLESETKEDRVKSLAQTMLTDEIWTPIPGYYGPKGAAIMNDALMSRFSKLFRLLHSKNALIRAVGAATYTQIILVPELATILIREDMKLGSYHDALQTMKDSRMLGELLNDDESDDAIFAASQALGRRRGSSDGKSSEMSDLDDDFED